MLNMVNIPAKGKIPLWRLIVQAENILTLRDQSHSGQRNKANKHRVNIENRLNRIHIYWLVHTRVGVAIADVQIPPHVL